MWAVRLEVDLEERKELKITENDISGDPEEGVYPSTIKGGGEKAGGQVGYLV